MLLASHAKASSLEQHALFRSSTVKATVKNREIQFLDFQSLDF